MHYPTMFLDSIFYSLNPIPITTLLGSMVGGDRSCATPDFRKMAGHFPVRTNASEGSSGSGDRCSIGLIEATKGSDLTVVSKIGRSVKGLQGNSADYCRTRKIEQNLRRDDSSMQGCSRPRVM